MKKFFKILMVFALLSGAALSCTKDYSKEIADVQKQNQELNGLIAALQSALNSTNATVSQISDLTGKNKEDIAAIVSANAEAFAEIVSSHADDVEYLEGLIAALEAAGVKQGTEIYAAIEALKAAQAQALATAIADLEGKIAAGDIAAAKVAADALAAAVETLNKAIAEGDATAAKTAADALAAAVAELKGEIAKGDEAAAKVAADALAAAVAELEAKIAKGDKAAADALADVVTELKSEIAKGDKAAADALDAAVETLNKAIAEGDATAAKAAADALAAAVAELEAKIAAGDKVAADALAAAVAELEAKIAAGDKAVEEAAAKALEAAVETLNKAIAAGDAATAEAAAEALADAVKDLEDKIAAGDAEVAEAAKEALAAAMTTLRDEIKAGDAEVAKAAKDALDKAVAELDGKIDTEVAALKRSLADEIAHATAKEDELAKEFAKEIFDLATKTEKDIANLKAEIEAKLDKKADETYVDAQDEMLKALIDANKAGLEKAIAELNTALKIESEEREAALANAQAQIDAATARISAIETMLDGYPEVRAQVAANKAGIEANVQEIEGLKATLKAEVDNLKEQIKTTQDDYKAADEALQKAIADLKEQVEVLSARLTNIVAAPAKNIEWMSVTIGDSTFVNLQMDFKVAPAAFAKVIADGFESGDVTVALNVTTGYARTKNNAAPADIDAQVTPFKVVSTKDGVISVSANLSGIENTPVVNAFEYGVAPVGAPAPLNIFAPYVSIIVSGTDYEGLTYERISEPVVPIINTINHGNNILEALKWHKNGEPVTEVANEVDAADSIRTIYKAQDEKKECAVAIGGKLIVALADLDWKTYGKFDDENVIKNYDLLIPAEFNPLGNAPLSIEEVAEMLHVPYSVFAPHFIKVGGKYLTPKYYEQIEWEGFLPGPTTTDANVKGLFASSADGSSLKIGVRVNSLPDGTDPQKAEFVGAIYQTLSTPVAYGQVDTLDGVVVAVLQRIGKHVDEYQATDPLKVEFKYNAGLTGLGGRVATWADTTFSALAWQSPTDIARHISTDGKLYKANEDGTYTYSEATKDEHAFAKITPVQAQTKFANVTAHSIHFAETEKTYRLAWIEEPYKNSFNVQAEDYIDYIPVTVAAYHKPTIVSAAVEGYFSLTTNTKIATGVGPNQVLQIEYSDQPKSYWFAGETPTPAMQNGWSAWYLDGFAGGTNSLEAKATCSPAAPYNVTLSYTAGYLNVEFPPVGKGFDSRTWTVSAKDTIDDVIAFVYNIAVKPKNIGANIAIRPGFPKNPDGTYVVDVEGNVSNENKYVIENINLKNYFDFVNVTQLAATDYAHLNAKFMSDSAILFVSDISETNAGTKVGTTAIFANDVTISWNDLKATSFVFKGVARVDNTAIQDTVKVKVQTPTPLRVAGEAGFAITRVPGTETPFNAIKDLRIEGIVTAGEDLPGQSPKTEWSNVLNPDGTVRTEAYDGGNYVNYGLAGAPVLDSNKITCTVNGQTWNAEQTATLITKVDDTHFTVNAESAIGTIVLILPYKWEYGFGTLSFNRVITIN